MEIASSSSTPSLPAIVFSQSERAGLRIAGLTVLDRLVVALHRAGIGPIYIVAQGELPSLKRTGALGIRVEVVRKPPGFSVPVLIALAQVLVQPSDLKRCVTEQARMLSWQGEPLPIGVANGAIEDVDLALKKSKPMSPMGVACLVLDHTSALAAQHKLWASLTSRSDGFVDKVFNRPCGRPISKLLIHTPISPNTVSLVSILIGVVSGCLFANGDYQATVLGAILFQVSAIIDCVDGDLARVLFKESRLGKWLDLAGDQVVHVAVFAGLAWGLLRSGSHQEILWLGASAIAGALISFAVVVRGMRRRSDENPRLQRLLDAATNRDFSVLVLVLACLQQLKVFLWMAAVGSHVFWIAALSLQFSSNRRTRQSG